MASSAAHSLLTAARVCMSRLSASSGFSSAVSLTIGTTGAWGAAIGPADTVATGAGVVLVASGVGAATVLAMLASLPARSVSSTAAKSSIEASIWSLQSATVVGYWVGAAP